MESPVASHHHLCRRGFLTMFLTRISYISIQVTHVRRSLIYTRDNSSKPPRATAPGPFALPSLPGPPIMAVGIASRYKTGLRLETYR